MGPVRISSVSGVFSSYVVASELPVGFGQYSQLRLWTGINWLYAGSGALAPLPANVRITAAWVEGPGSIYLALDTGNVLNWDGTWNTIACPGGHSLRAIWGIGTGAVFAVGDQGQINKVSGLTGSAMTGATADMYLSSVWGSSA